MTYLCLVFLFLPNLLASTPNFYSAVSVLKPIVKIGVSV